MHLTFPLHTLTTTTQPSPSAHPAPNPNQAGAQGQQELQAGTQLVGGNAWNRRHLGPAIIGFACAIGCYLSMRQMVTLRMRPSRGSGPHDHRGLPSNASRKRRKNGLTSR